MALGKNHVLLSGGRQLQISNAQLDDDARYTCIATNAIGAVDLDTFVQVIGRSFCEMCQL
jgi:hypothetical protein